MTAVVSTSRHYGRIGPGDAPALLRNPERIRYACNPYENPRWWHADARTRGADGLLAADAFAPDGAVDVYANEVSRIVHLPMAELIGFVQNDERMRLLHRDIPRDQPWQEPTGRTRPIVVPSVLRRCLSNLVADVLETTSDHLLPESAVAYRPGRENVVSETLIDVAADIHFGGKCFYWKFDLQNAFPSLPWVGVTEALEAIGYPKAFSDFVLALVRAPIVRRVNGRLILVPSDRGCPAGLPESAILLNIFLKPLDEGIGQRFPQLGYRRYSDDGVLVGAQRHIVVGAVRRTLAWARRAGVELKGQQPNQSAGSLVRDVRGEPLALLGAVIHPDGNIHIPREKIDRQLAKLRFMLDNTPELVGSTEVVAAVSQYAPDRRRVGLVVYDRSDFQKSFEQFFSYAFVLNEGDAFTFLGRVRRELGINPQLPALAYRQLVWVAALGDPDAVQAGGLRNLHGTESERLKEWFLQSVGRKSDESIDLDRVTVSSPGCSAEEVFGTNDRSVDEKDGIPSFSGDRMADEEDDWVVDGHLPWEGESDPLPREPKGSEGWADDSSSLTEWDGLPVEGTRSEFESETDRFSVRSVRFIPVTPDCTSSGAVDLAHRPEPPGRCDHDHVRVVHLVARRVARRRADGGTVVAVQELERDGQASQPSARFFEGTHEEAAVIETVQRLRVTALRAGQRALVVLLDDSELPKALLQRDRAFRRPGLLRRVFELHAPHPVQVVLAGPWPPPPRLVARIEEERDDRGQALRARRLGTTRRGQRVAP